MTKYSIGSILIFFFVMFNTAGGWNLKFGIRNINPNSWCIAKPSSSLEELNYNLMHACTTHSCIMIEKGGDCYEPNTLYNHASYVMNMFYAYHGKDEFFCNVFFGNSALIVLTDPSYEKCKFD
ncbi:hypothetical protein P8452_19219 [Trifolium repens]|nr:hypothetical protein P8452_19219 [Trifolium repens]